ncbi:hypothetical protein C6P42_003682 [Pichia californica]|nr:hypothetical protein C6P42_003682 [[Candida] californica]
MSRTEEEKIVETLISKYEDMITDEGELLLPPRLQWKNLRNDDRYYLLQQKYAKDFEFRQQDMEILKLLLIFRPREECQYDHEVYLNGPIYHHFTFDPAYAHPDHMIGLVFKNHKFISYIEDKSFRYDKYYKYLQSAFFLENISPRCILGNYDPTDYQLKFLPDFPNCQDFNTTISMKNPIEFWDYLAKAKVNYIHDHFVQCHKISLEIENGISHCLTFGQFIQVFPFLRNMKHQASTNYRFHQRSPKYLQNYIFYCNMTCSSDYSDKQMKSRESAASNSNKRQRLNVLNIQCPTKYQLAIDFKHRVVFIRSRGYHSDQCHPFQKSKGYLIMKKLMTVHSKKEVCKDLMNDKYPDNLLIYYGRDQINMKNIRNLKQNQERNHG